jgi:hypothetical protein
VQQHSVNLSQFFHNKQLCRGEDGSSVGTDVRMCYIEQAWTDVKVRHMSRNALLACPCLSVVSNGRTQ